MCCIRTYRLLTLGANQNVSRVSFESSWRCFMKRLRFGAVCLMVLFAMTAIGAWSFPYVAAFGQSCTMSCGDPIPTCDQDDTDNCGLNQCSTFCTSQGESREYLHTEVRGSTSGNDNIQWVTKPCYRVYQCVVGEDQSNRDCYSIAGPPQSCYWLAWATCHGCAFSEGLTIGVQSCEIVSCGT